MAKIGYIGLGRMGYPMAGFLAKAGHDVTVYNRSPAKAEQWLAEFKLHAKGSLKTAATAAEAAKDCDFVLDCVTRDNDVRDVTIGEHGAFKTMRKGAIFVDHTTASAVVARELGEKAAEIGLSFLDAPVSGGQAGADAGKLTIMCGGDKAIFDKVKPIVDVYAVSVRYLGGHGMGQLCKMVNQICLVGVAEGLAEGLAFGKKAGLDMETVLDVMTKGSASSWQMQHSGAKMLKGDFNFGFAVDLVRKDLSMCLDEARRNGATLPTTAIIDQFYADLQREGRHRYDVTSLMARLDK